MNNIKNLISNVFDKKEKWIVFVLYFPFMFSLCLYINGGIHYLMFNELFEILRIIAGLAIIILFIRKKKSPSILAKILIVFELWVLATTFLNVFIYWPKALYQAFLEALSVSSLALLVELYIDEPENLISGMMINYELFIYLNFISVVMYGASDGYGGSHYYLLEHRTVLIYWLLPALSIAALYAYQRKTMVRPVLLSVISVISIFVVWNATMVVALLAATGVFFSNILFNRIFKKEKRWPLILLFTLAIAVNIFIVFIYSPGRFTLIDSFIVNVLKKETNFTGRSSIWALAIPMIKEKLLIGYGALTRIEFESGWEAYHAHNELLQRLLITGLIGFVLFFVFHLIFIKKIDQTKFSIPLLVLISVIFGIYITYITESYLGYYHFIPLFFIGYHLDKVILRKSPENNSDRMEDKYGKNQH